MKQKSQEPITHQDCPEAVQQQLTLAGGTNRFGEPNYRVIWGFNRIVPITGEWQEFEQCVARLTDKVTGISKARKFTRLKSSGIETRLEPKYLPGNCWHLESWRAPEEYGSPETWGKQGQEVIGCMTVDTSGPFPSRGEYELCYPLTEDGTSHGKPIPLVSEVVAEIVRMIVCSRDRFNFQQRRAAIEQRMRREDEGFVSRTADILKEGLKPYGGAPHIVVPNTLN